MLLVVAPLVAVPKHALREGLVPEAVGLAIAYPHEKFGCDNLNTLVRQLESLELTTVKHLPNDALLGSEVLIALVTEGPSFFRIGVYDLGLLLLRSSCFATSCLSPHLSRVRSQSNKLLKHLARLNAELQFVLV